MDITLIDRNFFRGSPDDAGITYRAVSGGKIDLYGVRYNASAGKYTRMDNAVAATVSPGVENLAWHTSGGRARFSTSSRRIAIAVKYPYFTDFEHMALAGSSGFSLYADYKDGRSEFLHTYMPKRNLGLSFRGVFTIPDGVKPDGYTLYFPLYNAVNEVFIGVDDDSSVGGGLRYTGGKVLLYGSSITQGGVANTPGTCYPAFLSRALDIDYINLGFSGQGKAEPEIAAYLPTLDVDAFICDYDHNAPDAEYLERTHYALYSTYRAKRPDTPILFLSRPDECSGKADTDKRAEIVRNTYLRAVAEGDKNVWYIDGRTLLDGDDKASCLVDGCHPTDLGFYRMAKKIEPVLRKMLGK